MVRSHLIYIVHHQLTSPPHRKGGFHVSSLTDAPLQYLHSIAVDQPDPRHPSKKYKLHCLTCQSSIGAISTIFSSEKLLFKAKSVAIQMPEHQSPMVSLSGYPSSILTFNMWTELLLLLESQSQLKEKLKIKRVRWCFTTQNGI